MGNKKSIVRVYPQTIEELKALCPTDLSKPWYKAISPEELPSVFPDAFKEKMDHAVVMGSGTESGEEVYVVVNAYRVEERKKEIDQEPFGIILNSGDAETNGIFIHHGNWEGRTQNETIPEAFWRHVESSGIGNYYPPPGLQRNQSGNLDSLQPATTNAFWQMVRTLNANRDHP